MLYCMLAVEKYGKYSFKITTNISKKILTGRGNAFEPKFIGEKNCYLGYDSETKTFEDLHYSKP